MSKADKMFKEMGYKKQDYFYGTGYELEFHNVSIIFHTTSRLVRYKSADELINIKTHLAIHEKMKELGWLDE